MDTKKFEEIQEKIETMKSKHDRAEGAIEAAKKELMNRYGFDSFEDAKKKKDELIEQKRVTTDRLDTLFEKLETLTDWDAI
jgi:hypothetical protein